MQIHLPTKRGLTAIITCAVLGATLVACDSSTNQPAASGPTTSKPDLIGSLTDASFEAACRGALNDALQRTIPNVYGDDTGGSPEVSAINHNDPGIDCDWSGPDGTALYVEYLPLSQKVQDDLDKASPNSQLADAAGVKSAYIIKDSEYGTTGGAWTSGNHVVYISADQTSLTPDQLAAIVKGLASTS